MEKKLVVLVDLDGVVVDTTPTWVQEYCFLSGDTLKVSDIVEYDFGKFAANPKIFWDTLELAQVFHRSQPMPDAVRAARFLSKMADVHVCTYVHPLCPSGYVQKLDWLAHWLPDLVPSVVFTREKHLIQGDVLIEDSPDNVEAWLENNANGRAYLIDHPYNREYNHVRCTRVKSLMEVVYHLQGEMI